MIHRPEILPREVRRVGRGDDGLDVLALQKGEQGFAAAGVEFAHDVIEKENRIFSRFGAEEFELGELEGERAGALLALRAVGAKVDAVDGDGEVVAVRADARDAAQDVEFVTLL